MKHKLIKFLTVTLSLCAIPCVLMGCDSTQTQGQNQGHTHEYRTEIISPTCTKEGYTKYICSCGYNYKSDETSRVGHDYEDYKCTVCGREIYPSEGLHYTLSEDKTYYIVAGMGNCTDKEVVIPAVYEDLPVKEIGEDAFNYYVHYKKITSVEIPDSVTKIGKGAFKYCDLTSIILPPNLINIEEGAFSSCDLTSVRIPDSVISIGKEAFKLCRLTSVVIPDSVTTIGERAFKENEITSIKIPDSVITIGEGAFAVCKNLSNISVGENNLNYCSINGDLYNKDGTTLIQYAIGKTANSFTIPDKVRIIGDNAFATCNNLISVIIPDSVTRIGEFSFNSCENLSNITFGKNLETIGKWAFYYCKNLTSVELPDNLRSIAYDAFDDCNNLTNISVSENSLFFSSIDGNLYNKDLTELIFYAKGKTATSFTIPNSVTTIGNRAFLDCVHLTSVTIPDSVTIIEGAAFFGCDNLINVVISDSVTNIGSQAFYSCEDLSYVKLGGDLTCIDSYAFGECWNLNSIEYNGTIEQWKEIEKGYSWVNSVDIVKCIDGETDS